MSCNYVLTRREHFPALGAGFIFFRRFQRVPRFYFEFWLDNNSIDVCCDWSLVRCAYHHVRFIARFKCHTHKKNSKSRALFYLLGTNILRYKFCQSLYNSGSHLWHHTYLRSEWLFLFAPMPFEVLLRCPHPHPRWEVWSSLLDHLLLIPNRKTLK